MQTSVVGYIKRYVEAHYPDLKLVSSNVFGHDGVATYRVSRGGVVYELIISLPRTAPQRAIPLLQKVSSVSAGYAVRIWEFKQDCEPYVPIGKKWRVHLCVLPEGAYGQVHVDETDGEIVQTVLRLDGKPFKENILTNMLVAKYAKLWKCGSRLTNKEKMEIASFFEQNRR